LEPGHYVLFKHPLTQTTHNVKITCILPNCIRIWTGSHFQLETVGSFFLSKPLLSQNLQISKLDQLFSNYRASVSFSLNGVTETKSFPISFSDTIRRFTDHGGLLEDLSAENICSSYHCRICITNQPSSGDVYKLALAEKLCIVSFVWINACVRNVTNFH
jgi:hypothetical protein